MKQQHHPHDIRIYAKGANRDVDDELIGLSDGQYIDACNMRVTSMDGDKSSIKKINGEVVEFPNIDNRCSIGTGAALASTYVCTAVAELNNNVFEVWTDSDGVEPSLIRVNGLIVLMSDDFPALATHPFQLAKNEACIGGEVYLTDYKSAPMLFNIKDLLLNSGVDVGNETGDCTDKYFGGYNHKEQILILVRTLDHPVFVKLDASASGYDFVFGTGGLPVGYVSYSMRYVTSGGDRTAWSAATPQIPIVRTVSSDCVNFPWSKTISKDPDISIPSVYGAHIKFRIDNQLGYDFIEVRRDSWIAGDPLSTPPISDIIGNVDIVDNQFGIVDILDRGGFESSLSIDDLTEVMAAIERAKAIRYFNQRLYLMNVEYGSRVIDDVILIGEDTETPAFPTIEHMGHSGHSDPYNGTYHKSTMRGEKKGYGIILWDDQGQNTFAKKIIGAENFQMPNRRDPASIETQGTSYFGTVKAADVNGVVNNCHEVFDLTSATERSDLCAFHNIISDGVIFRARKSASKVNGDENSGCFQIGGLFVSGDDIGHAPFTPTSQNDVNCTGHNAIINPLIRNRAVTPWVDYRPTGFSPNYYSAGMAFKGVDTASLPDWATGFSIVETPPAGRVVAQGLGYYSLSSAEGSLQGNATKELREFAIYFPDLDDATGIDPSVIDAIKADPSAFEIQLVSPMGFFTEVFSFNNFNNANQVDSGIDMITYCRVLRDNGEINPLASADNPNLGIDDGGGIRYVSYGKWRSETQFSAAFPSGSGGNQAFDIDSVTDYTSSSGRQKYLRLKTSSSFYSAGDAGGQHHGNRPKVQDWHEPVYAVNIVRKLADIADTNISRYNYTGNYQKLKSKIGISDGTDGQIYPLVDERWEDCIQKLNGQTQNDYDGLHRFICIRDTSGSEKVWLNVAETLPAALTIILATLQASGVATVTDTSGSYQIHGVYKSSETVDFTAAVFNINIDWFDTTYDRKFFIPEEGFELIVKYDNRIPVRVFGGGTWIGESTWAVKDKEYDKKADPVNPALDNGSGAGDDFRLNIAFPYTRYKVNDRIYIVNDTTGINKLQDNNVMQFSSLGGTKPARVRQLIAMWTAETRINLSFAFNDESTLANSDQHFALKNYVMRPYSWKDDNFGGDLQTIYETDNALFAGYETDYGEEYTLWQYGGFRFKPQTNLDYSKRDVTKAFSSFPQVGVEEQNLYCTRIIWSDKRPINIQDTPTVRTFPEDNSYDLSDDTGEIKFGWDADSAKGNNLYAITDSGVALLLVDKRIIHEINANELATVGSDVGGILNELWLEREIGMTDEMWRSAAEYSNRLYFVNYNSSFMLDANKVADIGRIGYHSKIYPEYLQNFGSGYVDHITGVYDVLHDEYWVNFKKKPVVIEEFSFITRLNLVSSFYGDQDYANAFYGLDDGETVEFSASTPIETQIGIILGSLTGTMLFQVACVQVADDSPHPIKVSQVVDGILTELITIPQGQCYCFTPDFITVLTGREELPQSKFNGYTFDTCDITDFGKCPTLVWNQEQRNPAASSWEGGFDYNFDKYLSFENKTYGMRDMETYLLNEGRIINGSLIDAHVIGASVAEQYKDKEYIRMRVNSDNKPVRIEFFNDLSQLLSNNVQALLDTVTNPQALKNYYGFEQYIPRKTAAPRNRMQGRLLIFKIIHNLDEDFRISSTDVQYKGLK